MSEPGKAAIIIAKRRINCPIKSKLICLINNFAVVF